MAESVYNEETLNQLLPLYYKRVFPISQIYKWLCYGRPAEFSKREISFTLFGNVYFRYNTFGTVKEFAKALNKKVPLKIDIGAFYETDLRKQGIATSLNPVKKELVFDIDMTDYDDVRTCCSKTDVCKKCWKFIVIGCKVLENSLRENYGYKHILWVFSGRRGVHCWVADEGARTLDKDGRTGIAGYFHILKPGTPFKKIIKLNTATYSSLKEALDIIDIYFESIIEEQDILGTDQRFETFLKMIGSEIGPLIEKDMRMCQTSSLTRWKTFESTFKKLYSERRVPKYLKYKVEETKLYYTFPRIDFNVTSGVNHLLKAPFCVHPKTGRISVPFNSEYIDCFDPNCVPNINGVIDEIKAYHAKTKEHKQILADSGITDKSHENYDKTSLLKYVEFFKEFLRDLQVA